MNQAAMMTKRWGLLTVLLAMLFLPLSTGEATTLLKVDLDELVYKADAIVIGSAQESICRWDKNRERIYTYTRFVVDEVIKGDSRMTETFVKVPGGDLDEISMDVLETAQLTESGHYILFLFSRAEDYMSNVVGWRQGQYTIENGIVLENQKPADEFIAEIQAIVDAE